MRKKFFGGQAIIVILLVVVVALTIGLSVSTRTIRDVRVSTRTEESQRAFSAAEAGLEAALLSGGDSGTVYLDSTAGVSYDYTTKSAGMEQDFVFPEKIEKDDTQQVWLLTHDSDGDIVEDCSSGCYEGKKLWIYWGNQGATTVVPAIEVSVIYNNGEGYKIQKYAFDPDSGRRAQNNFDEDDGHEATGISSGEETYNFAYGQEINLPVNNVDSSHYNAIVRLRLLYNTEKHLLGVGGESSDEEDKLPKQGEIADSLGTVQAPNSDVKEVRKLSAFKSYPFLPGIFDFVLFSGSDLTKN